MLVEHPSHFQPPPPKQSLYKRVKRTLSTKGGMSIASMQSASNKHPADILELFSIPAKRKKTIAGFFPPQFMPCSIWRRVIAMGQSSWSMAVAMLVVVVIYPNAQYLWPVVAYCGCTISKTYFSL